MPNIYTSKNVENGLTFDDLITKLLAYKPEQWGYTEQDFNNIKTDFNVSENSLYNLPLGNYKLKNMPNSPFNSEFVNVKTLMNRDDKLAICSIGGSIDYGTNLSETNPNGSGWKDLSTDKRQNIDAAIIVVSDTAPVGPFNNGIPLWVDTSKAYITGEIFLKILSGNDTWTSYTVTDSMDMSIYDKNGLKKDPYKEVMNEVEKFIGDYTEIIMHINNELKLIHIDASDREYFDTYLLTSENVAKYFEEGGEFYTEMVEYVKSTITTTTGLDTSVVSANFNTLKESLKSHYDNHVTEKDVENWNNKAAADHTHNLDPNVTVDVSDIAFGDSNIPDAAIPDSVKERPILITSFSVLRNIDTSLLESTYHNGNMLYLANGNDGYDFYKIVDNSYFNTEDYMKGVKKFSVEIDEVNFADAIKEPSTGYTLADYGIADALSRSDLEKLEKSYEDELKCEIIPSNLTAEAVGTSDLYVKVEQSSNKSEINVYVSIDASRQFEDDVYQFKYAKKEININMGTLPSTQFWYSVCYGKDKFVAVADETNVVAYSLDGITWTEGTLPSSQRWCSVCYGKDKFVAVAYTTNVFAYSLDGITWTQGNMPSSQQWQSVCYGKDKFVAISYISDVFAYSLDGITWTQGALPSTQYWISVCYGKDKFVAVAPTTKIFAYSSDGITWTQGTMPVSEEWRSVCYGKDKFVAIVYNSDVFAYSSDGITWAQGTLPVNKQWQSVCYGKDKFVAVALDSNSNVFAYIQDTLTNPEQIPTQIFKLSPDSPLLPNGYIGFSYRTDLANRGDINGFNKDDVLTGKCYIIFYDKNLQHIKTINSGISGNGTDYMDLVYKKIGSETEFMLIANIVGASKRYSQLCIDINCNIINTWVDNIIFDDISLSACYSEIKLGFYNKKWLHTYRLCINRIIDDKIDTDHMRLSMNEDAVKESSTISVATNINGPMVYPIEYLPILVGRENIITLSNSISANNISIHDYNTAWGDIAVNRNLHVIAQKRNYAIIEDTSGSKSIVKLIEKYTFDKELLANPTV